MLTPAQQRVKKELDELKAFGQIRHADEHDAPSKKLSGKKWIYIIFGIILFAFTFSNMQNCYLALSQGKVHSYLEKECEYNNESVELLQADLDLDQTNAAHPHSGTALADLLKKLKALNVPAGFYEHNRDLIAVMEQRLAISAELSKSPVPNTFELNKALLELKVRQELALNSLPKAFDNEKINYASMKDGTLQYWIDGKSFKYKMVQN